MQTALPRGRRAARSRPRWPHGWRAGRGPHGGYLAAIILRALTLALDDPPALAALADDPLPEGSRGGAGADRDDDRAQRALAQLAVGAHEPGRSHDGARAGRLLGAVDGAGGGTSCRCPRSRRPDAERRPGHPDPARARRPPFARYIVLQRRFGGTALRRRASSRWRPAAGSAWSSPARSTRWRSRSSPTR